MSLCIPSSSRSPDHDPHRTIYYLGYPLGRFSGLKHRQLARQVGVIITTGRIRRTSSAKSYYRNDGWPKFSQLAVGSADSPSPGQQPFRSASRGISSKRNQLCLGQQVRVRSEQTKLEFASRSRSNVSALSSTSTRNMLLYSRPEQSTSFSCVLCFQLGGSNLRDGKKKKAFELAVDQGNQLPPTHT
jgi:hypothetical protein